MNFLCPRFSDSLTFESNSVIAQVQLWVFSVTKATCFLLWYIFMVTYTADLTCSCFCFCSFIFFCKISCTACPRFWLVRPWFDASSSQQLSGDYLFWMLILGWMKPVFWVFWTCFVVLAPSLHGIRPDSLLNPADSQETLLLCCGNHLCRDVGADFCRRRWEEVRLMAFCRLRGRIQLEALGWNC